MNDYKIIGYELDVFNNQLLIHVLISDVQKVLQDKIIKALGRAVSVDVDKKPVMCASPLSGGDVIYKNNNMTAPGDSGGCVFVQTATGYCICGSITAGVGSVGYYSPVTYPMTIGFSPKTN